MAHGIDTTTGNAACFTVGEPAWHKLGVNVKEAQDSAAVRKLCPAIFFGIDKVPLFYKVGDDYKQAPDKFATVRQDTGGFLGVVGPDYRVLPNDEMLNFADTVVGQKLAVYHTAGSLFDGRRAWCMLKLPNEIRVGKDDITETFSLFATSHDGSLALTVMPTSVRVVCQNTLNLALGDGKRKNREGIRIYHSQSLDTRLEEARKTLGIVSQRFDMFQTQATLLGGIKVPSSAKLYEYFKAVFPPKSNDKKAEKAKKNLILLEKLKEKDFAEEDLRQLEESMVLDVSESSPQYKTMIATLTDNFESRMNNPLGAEGSYWSALQSVTEYVDYQKRGRAANDADRLNARANAILFGTDNVKKQEALDKALEMAQAA